MIHALVIDDSAFNRVTLSRMLGSSRDIRVVATAVDGEDGIRRVIEHSPDLVVLDLEMPVMDGFAFLRWLMANRPIPVIAVSSKASDRSVFKALELGAIDFIAKPGGRISPRLEEIRADLIAKAHRCTEISIEAVRRRLGEPEPGRKPAGLVPEQCKGGIELVVVGCSTGGPPAVQHLFQSLPLLPVPFVVAQHMPATFTRLFAERLDKLTAYHMKEAAHGEILRPGTVYIAPGGRQTEVARAPEGLQVRCSNADAGDVYAPSVDRLFASASAACGGAVIAVVMTGMGSDGATGMRSIHERGGRTIAESAATAVIFGMPNAAIEAGAVDEVQPLPDIPEAIRRFCAGA
jgi:two-component system, chemotaxis family, protein-glutamate methylesterase/glutaminase